MNHISTQHTLFFLFFILSPFAAKAQDSKDEFFDKAIEIKENEAYIVADEVFDDNFEKAYQTAIVVLLEQVNTTRRNGKLYDLRRNDIEIFVEKLYNQTENSCVVMLYVPKDKVMAIGAPQNFTVQNQTPNNGHNQQLTTTSTASTSSTSSASTSNTLIVQTAPVDFDPSNIIQTLCSQDTYIEIKGFIERWKQEGKIVFSGMTKNPAEVPADANAIVIGDRYKIMAILSPRNKSNRIDYKTGDEDDESNHPGYSFIIWYRTNNSK